MKIYIEENVLNDNSLQTIIIPMKNLYYTLVSNYNESYIITKDDTYYSNRKLNGYNCDSKNDFKNILEEKINVSLGNAIKKALSLYPTITCLNINKSFVSNISYVRRSTHNGVYEDTFSFAFYLDLVLDCSKYKLNNKFSNYVSEFTIRFADHVTIANQGELLNIDDISLSNIMLIDKNNNALTFKEVKDYLKEIINYRINIFTVLDYLKNKLGNNLTSVTKENIDKLSDYKFSEFLSLFNENKMKPEKLSETDFDDYEK